MSWWKLIHLMINIWHDSLNRQEKAKLNVRAWGRKTNAWVAEVWLKAWAPIIRTEWEPNHIEIVKKPNLCPVVECLCQEKIEYTFPASALLYLIRIKRIGYIRRCLSQHVLKARQRGKACWDFESWCNRTYSKTMPNQERRLILLAQTPLKLLTVCHYILMFIHSGILTAGDVHFFVSPRNWSLNSSL